MMKRILGVGSPFGLDRIGWSLVKTLRYNKHIKDYPDLELIIEDRPGLNILSLMDNCQSLFIIDAVVSHDAVGTCYEMTAAEIVQSSTLLSSHGCGVAQSIAMAEALQILPKEFLFYGINIGDDLNAFQYLPQIKSSLLRLKYKLITNCVEK